MDDINETELSKARAFAFKQCETPDEVKYILGDDNDLLISMEDEEEVDNLYYTTI